MLRSLDSLIKDFPSKKIFIIIHYMEYMRDVISCVMYIHNFSGFERDRKLLQLTLDEDE